MTELELHIGNVEHMTPEQEKVFFKKFERELSEMDDSAARETLAMGIPICYSDDRYPGETIREYPDGRRELIDMDEEYNIIVKRVLP